MKSAFYFLLFSAIPSDASSFDVIQQTHDILMPMRAINPGTSERSSSNLSDFKRLLHSPSSLLEREEEENSLPPSPLSEYLESTDEDGNTFLKLALDYNHLHLAEFLVAAGASLTTKNNTGQTVVDIAKEKAREEREGIQISKHPIFAAQGQGAASAQPARATRLTYTSFLAYLFEVNEKYAAFLEKESKTYVIDDIAKIVREYLELPEPLIPDGFFEEN